MKDNLFKHFVRSLLFRQGSVRRIRLGPLRGMVFRVSPITGLSPWYSGAERQVQLTLRTLVHPGDTVLDVGANWGLHTLYLSRLVGEKGRVLSFEPFGPAFAELDWHIHKNRCPNVQAMPLALSDADGQALFVPQGGSEGRFLSAERDSMQELNVTLVSTRRLDSVIEEVGVFQLSLIKIDVEGAESRVLKGARETIRRFRPSLVIELHNPEQDYPRG